MARWLTGVLLLLLSLVAGAASISGRVVGVVDGDTVDVLMQDNTTERIRVAGIDAPEKRQAFGMAAKHRMSELVYDRAVTVEYEKRDRYQRIIGVVRERGRDAGLELIRSGLAWHYKKYEREQSVGDREAYAIAEDDARGRRVGLWGDESQVTPWEWRKR